MVVSVILVSYRSRSIISGSLIGLSTITTWFAGFLLGGLIILPDDYFHRITIETIPDYPPFITAGRDMLRLFIWKNPAIFQLFLAFLLLGSFFGLFGYISEKLFTIKPISQLYVLRDYWSSIYGLRRNKRIESNSLDRQFSMTRLSWGFNVKNWWMRMTQEIVKPDPELIFTSQSDLGDIFDISTGRRIISDVADPSELVSKYKPHVMSAPALASSLGGVRKMAFEELTSRFLGWFINSRLLWIVYSIISILFFNNVIAHYYNPKDPKVLLPWEFITTLIGISSQSEGSFSLLFNSGIIYSSCLIVSVLLLSLVYIWKRFSSQFYQKRPDERLLVFSVFLILALFYGMFSQILTQNLFSVFFIDTWYVFGAWSKWLMLLTTILGLTYIFIHRESEITNIYLYQKEKSESHDSLFPYINYEDRPFWLDEEETDTYWVLRYMYYWRYELTLLPHSDWERVEVWIDAKTGKAKWVVSDYHYRELWYKVEDDISGKLYVSFLINFHTPIPLVNKMDLNRIRNLLSIKTSELLNILLTGVQIQPIKTNDKYTSLHSDYWVQRYGLPKVAAGFCSKLPWTYWRYPYGIDNREKYGRTPAAINSDQPFFNIE
ncbi:hypothetical protein GF319_12590 [Candidatus Bathyarchaeota archaeon]|nr:hypothetical protein [Candidatus Bathyarchaeota archaeon]